MPKNREKANVVSIEEARKKPFDVDAERHRAIEAYLDAGYALFPCEGKKPVAGSKGASTTFDPTLEPSDFDGDYGVVLKPDDLVIDVDPRAFARRRGGRIERRDGEAFSGPWKKCKSEAVLQLKEGEHDNPLPRFLSDIGCPDGLDTYTVVTGRGGYHIHLKTQVAQKTNTRLADYPGLEFKRFGTYVIGPGSIHEDTGKPYRIKRKSPKKIIDAPDEMLLLLQKEAHYETKGFEDYTEDEHTIWVVTEYLKNVEPAVEGDFGDPHTCAVARFGYDWGISPDLMLELMLEHFNPRCSPPWEVEDLKVKVYSSYTSATDKLGNRNVRNDFVDLDDEESPASQSDLEAEERKISDRWNTEKGEIRVNDLANTMAFLTLPGQDLYRLFMYDELRREIRYTRLPPWQKRGKPNFFDQSEVTMVTQHFAQERHYRVSKDVAADAVLAVTRRLYSVHPIIDYLESLTWDGVNRLETLLPYYAGSPDNPYTREVSKNTMLGAVYRIMQPGCKLDQVLILEGDQGNEKGKFIETLSLDYCASIKLTLRDEERAVQALQGVWFVDLDEIDQYLSVANEQAATKSFITRKFDHIRLSYERKAMDYPRQCIIIGSCNAGRGGYMSDLTGNRRYWPVVTKTFLLDELKQDRDQLWAEALYRYNQGEKYWIHDPEIVEMAKKEAMARTMMDPRIEMLREGLCQYRENYLGDPDKPPVTLRMIHNWLGKPSFNRLEHARLVDLMWSEGYIMTQDKNGTPSEFMPKEDVLLGDLL